MQAKRRNNDKLEPSLLKQRAKRFSIPKIPHEECKDHLHGPSHPSLLTGCLACADRHKYSRDNLFRPQDTGSPLSIEMTAPTSVQRTTRPWSSSYSTLQKRVASSCHFESESKAIRPEHQKTLFHFQSCIESHWSRPPALLSNRQPPTLRFRVSGNDGDGARRQ
jgi:hypothetical protein